MKWVIGYFSVVITFTCLWYYFASRRNADKEARGQAYESKLLEERVLHILRAGEGEKSEVAIVAAVRNNHEEYYRDAPPMFFISCVQEALDRLVAEKKLVSTVKESTLSSSFQDRIFSLVPTPT